MKNIIQLLLKVINLLKINKVIDKYINFSTKVSFNISFNIFNNYK